MAPKQQANAQASVLALSPSPSPKASRNGSHSPHSSPVPPTNPVSPETPATAPPPAIASARPRPAGKKASGKKVAAAIAAEKITPWIEDPDLFCLQPALTYRTRILVASYALLQMNMCQDIVKSFEVAGYFPRRLPAKLRAAMDKLALANGDLADGEVRRGAKRKRVDEVCLFVNASCHSHDTTCSLTTRPRRPSTT